MTFTSFIFMASAVFMVSAKSCVNTSPQSNAYNVLNVYRSSVPVINSHYQTGVVQNPTVNLPSYVPPATVAESCHCMKTIVRPQIRNEYITVPSVGRLLRTVSNPIVETFSGNDGKNLMSYAGRSVQGSSSGTTNGFYGDATGGRSSCQGSKSLSYAGYVNNNPSMSALQSSPTGNFPGFAAAIFTGSSSMASGGRSTGY